MMSKTGQVFYFYFFGGKLDSLISSNVTVWITNNWALHAYMCNEYDSVTLLYFFFHFLYLHIELSC